jgi:transcriptional regulator with XRE-family HTH domain
MELSEKIKHLREVEGDVRGLGRAMTQTEVVNVMQDELHETISQAYLSQLEKGRRVHLTANTRDLLARFFKVQPGYLVSDLEDYSTDLLTDLGNDTDRLQAWLAASAEDWRVEPPVADFFERLASVENPRLYLTLFRELLAMPAEAIETLVGGPHANNGGASDEIRIGIQ